MRDLRIENGYHEECFVFTTPFLGMCRVMNNNDDSRRHFGLRGWCQRLVQWTLMQVWITHSALITLASTNCI